MITAWPFPEKQDSERLPTKVKAIVVAELNLGQMVREVERAAAGKAVVTVRRPRRRQRPSARRHPRSHHGGGAMSSDYDTIHNPVEPFLRMDRIPHIWCPGCGIGTSVNCLQPRADRLQGRPQQAGHRLRHRLHRTRCRIRQPGLVPHHPRTRDSLRHRPEAGQSQAERRGLLGRRRSVRHRRQSPHPCRAPQCRSQGRLHQQPDLRHDRRPDRADHAELR